VMMRPPLISTDMGSPSRVAAGGRRIDRKPLRCPVLGRPESGTRHQGRCRVAPWASLVEGWPVVRFVSPSYARGAWPVNRASRWTMCRRRAAMRASLGVGRNYVRRPRCWSRRRRAARMEPRRGGGIRRVTQPGLLPRAQAVATAPAPRECARRRSGWGCRPGRRPRPRAGGR